MKVASTCTAVFLMLYLLFVLVIALQKDIYLSDDSIQWSQCAADDQVTSDLEDPAHDQEILDLLFYKNISKDDQKVDTTCISFYPCNRLV